MYNSFFFQNISLPTFFSQIFTTFEYNLIGICDKICDCNKEKFSYKDLRGSDLERASIYLKRTLNIDISKYDDWKLIVQFQSIRNKIVHGHCTFKKGADFQKTLESYKGVITNGSDYEHRIFSFKTTDIHVDFIQLIHRCFSKLFEDIYQYYLLINHS